MGIDVQVLCQLAEYLSFQGEHFLAVSYKRLGKFQVDKDIKKKDLYTKAGIIFVPVAKMGENGHVTTGILLKACTALNYQIEDIMEFVPDDE